MPSFSYTVISSIPPGPTSSSDPVLTPASGLSTCIPRYITEDDFLDLIDRILPFDYIQPLKDPGPGYEIFQMMAAVFERVALAIGRTECSFYVGTAHGGFKAEGKVEFYRDNNLNGAFTVLAGTRVRNSVTKIEFELIQDVIFGASDLIREGIVRARQADFAFNLTGIVVDINGNELEGEINEINLPFLNPPLAEPNIQVRQTTDIEKGQPASLDALGEDRAIKRHLDEGDDEYRFRIRSLPETVSPESLIKQIESIFLPLGETFDFIETFENRYQSGWSCPLTTIPNPFVGPYDPNLFVYNDPRGNVPFRNRWMGAEDVGGIIVVVPNLASFEESGFLFDDPALTSADHETKFGRRSYSAFDIPVPDDLDSNLSIGPSYDGDDYKRNSVYAKLADSLRKSKPAGVSLAIELEGQ